MEHLDAVRLSAVEKYLLNELTPEIRDEFEEHYFDCGECAEDLRTTATFLDLAKNELKGHPQPKPSPANGNKTRRFFLWSPAFLAPALAASLMVIAYQNIVVLPRATNEVASLRGAEVLPVVSLLGGNSRGSVHSDEAPVSRPFSLSVDIPSEDRFSSYTCELLSPSGTAVWHVEVSPQQAKDTVSIRVPGLNEPGATYTLVVRGNSSDAKATSGSEVIRYSFVLQKKG